MGRVIRKFKDNHKRLASEERKNQLRHLNTVSGKTRLLDAVDNASNNDLVGTNTLVKSAIVQVDAAPFKKNNEVTGEFKNLESDQMELMRANLMDKEMELQSVMWQNESLRSEMEKKKVNDEAFAEVDKSRKIAENAREELRAELEADLRRLNIQCDLSTREQEIKDTI